MPMTDDIAAPTRANLVPAPARPTPNPWVNGLGVAGFLLVIAGGIDFLIPPAATDSGLGSVVNFPSMLMQYGLGLGAIVLGTGLVIAWGVSGAREWRHAHPAR